MAQYLGETYTGDGVNRVVAEWRLAIPNPQVGFCTVCTVDVHPAVPECVWLTDPAPPDMARWSIDALTLFVEGTATWWISWNGPAGKLYEGTIAEADGLIDIPTVGSGPKRREDLRGGSVAKL